MHIPYRDIPLLSERDRAYLVNPERFRAFLPYMPDIGGLQRAMQHRANMDTDRDLLISVLEEQYAEINMVLGEKALLRAPDSFTVTTAHQPVLLGGPLYTVFKIASTIHLSRSLQKKTGKKIVPVFVMGTEDHDFEEINHFRLFGKHFEWKTKQPIGPVGRLTMDELLNVLSHELFPLFGEEPYAEALHAIIRSSFIPGRSYGRSYQAFILKLFQGSGLVVLDMDSPVFKRVFGPVIREELLHRPVKTLITDRQEAFKEHFQFDTQIYAREINLFYQQNGLRKRIEKHGQKWKVVRSSLEFDEKQILEELNLHPESFSPNVALRPLYQELMLPNIAYVGGPSELAYWMELGKVFEHFHVPFPVLLRRPSAMWIPPSNTKTLRRFGLLERSRLFLDLNSWEKIALDRLQKDPIPQKEIYRYIRASFELLQKSNADESLHLEKFLAASQSRIEGQMEGVINKLRKQLKQKHSSQINKIQKTHQHLYPKNGLQERYENFIPAYLRYGQAYLEALMEYLDPLSSDFTVFLPD